MARLVEFEERGRKIVIVAENVTKLEQLLPICGTEIPRTRVMCMDCDYIVVSEDIDIVKEKIWPQEQ